ncbi:hypothetical protein ACKFKF_34125 [Phormidesmis sp. 146-12]
MRKQSFQSSVCKVSEMTRLLTHIQHCAIDSEGSSIRPDEVSVVAEILIQRLVWQHPNFEQMIQEILDDLRFGNV